MAYIQRTYQILLQSLPYSHQKRFDSLLLNQVTKEFRQPEPSSEYRNLVYTTRGIRLSISVTFLGLFPPHLFNAISDRQFEEAIEMAFYMHPEPLHQDISLTESIIRAMMNEIKDLAGISPVALRFE